MRARFDQLGKQIAQAALRASGVTIAQAEISPETQYADLHHIPDPAHAAERDRLGLLGRLTATPCLIELYAQAPGDAQFRACLGKHIASWRRISREARKRGRSRRSAAFAAPFLWIIAAGTPTSLVRELTLEPAPGWPAGVYLFGGNSLRVGLVAANQLPRDRSTLLVRLMAAGRVLRPAIVELSALPAKAYERVAAGQILVRFQRVLGLKPSRTQEEQEFLVTMVDVWEQAAQKARKKALKEGRNEALAKALLTVLRARGIPVPAAEHARILAETDPDRLERWLERAAVAGSLAAVLAGRAAPRRRSPRGRRGSGTPAG